MSAIETTSSPAAQPTGSAANVDPAQLAAQFTDDGTPRWGVVKVSDGERIGWVDTGLTFAEAKNKALELNSNESDLSIDYVVQRQPDPEPDYEEIIIQGPIIRATSGTILTETQTAKNVFPRCTSTVRVPVVAATAAPAPEDAPEQVISDLRAEIERLNNVNRRILQAVEDADAATEQEVEVLRTALDKANAQITELQARPDNSTLVAAPDDALTLAYLRKWYEQLPQAEKDAQPALIHDLVVQWHKRGITWHKIVRACEGSSTGKTPYELSPPIGVHQGQGAIQSKKKTKSKKSVV